MIRLADICRFNSTLRLKLKGGDLDFYGAYFHKIIGLSVDASLSFGTSTPSAGISISPSAKYQKRSVNTHIRHSNVFLKSSAYIPSDTQSVTLYRIRNAYNEKLCLTYNPKDNDKVYFAPESGGNNQLFRLIDSVHNYECGLNRQIGYYRIESQVASNSFLSTYVNSSENNKNIVSDYGFDDDFQNFIIRYERSVNEGSKHKYSIATAGSDFLKVLTSYDDLTKNVKKDADIVQYSYRPTDDNNDNDNNLWFFEEVKTFDPGTYDLPKGDKITSYTLSTAKVYALRNKHNNRYLTTVLNNLSDYAEKYGSSSVTWSSFVDSGNAAYLNSTYPNQYAEFTLKYAGVESGKSCYNIVPQYNQQLALDVANASKNSGGKLQYYNRNGTNAQKFYLERVEANLYRIYSACTDFEMCLDFYGTSVYQGPPTVGNSQYWYFEEINGSGSDTAIVEENTYYYIQSVGNGTVLEVENGATSNRTRLKHKTLNADAYYQQFKILQQNDGSVFIQPRHTNKYVYEGVTLSSFIGIYDLDASNSKFHFKLLPNTDGSFRIATGYSSYQEIFHAETDGEIQTYLGFGDSNWRLVKANTNEISQNDKCIYLGLNHAEKTLWFTPTKTGYYTFETYGNYDTYISVYKNNSLLRTFDDTGTRYNAKIVNLMFDKGQEYEIRVRMYSVGKSGVVGFGYHYSAASSSDIIKNVTGTTYEYYEFTPLTQREYVIRIFAEDNKESYLAIFDAQTDAIIATDAFSGGNSQALIRITLLSGKTYKIGMRFYYSNQSGNIRLTIE